MFYSDKHKIIFISVPKTGSSSIGKILSGRKDVYRNKVMVNGKLRTVKAPHSRALVLRNIMGNEWSNYATVAFVRNPWAKVVSAYFFYNNGRARSHIWRGNGIALNALVNVLLAKILPFKLWVRLKPVRPCADYICDENGKVIVDKVFKLENIEEGYSYLCEKLHIEETPLKATNKSKHKRYQTYYDEKTRQYVARHHMKDIELFGYTFDD